MKPIDIIGLKNFRIFDFTTGFLGELSSINILTGANNSGKSSIIKALQMLKNSSKQNQFPLQLDLNQQEHFLGDFNNVLFDNKYRDLTVSLPFTFLGMKNIYVALKYEVPASKNTFTASLRAIQVVDKSDQSIVFSFTYRDATDQEKQDHRAIFDAEMTEYEAQKGETTDLMTAFINGNSRWLIPPHQNPLEGYIEWSMNLEKLKSYLSKLRNFYLLYIENKGKWIGLDKIDDRAHDIFFIPSVLVNSFTKDIGPESWNDFIDNVIGDLKKIEGKEKIGQDAFESDEYFLPRPEIEEVLYWETLKIFKSKLVWNITDDEGANHSIMANSFESSWKALAQRISTISYV
ncbi:MAG: AAA family ATPase, partial [Spirochaetales bacterium]|nr:AAA family ATPase [Spirochaetales bacterium]